MAKLAFIGLGLMGIPMATRLVEPGHDLTVWNRSTEKTRPLAERGALVASTPAQAAAGVDAVITMVTDPAALERVVLGEDGLATVLTPGQLLIDMSTVGPDAVGSIAARLPRGVSMVDAPVRGSVPRRPPAGSPSSSARTHPTSGGPGRSWRRSVRRTTSAGRELGQPRRWS